MIATVSGEEQGGETKQSRQTLVEGVLGVFHLANYLLQHDAKLFARLQRRNHPFLGGCALLHSRILLLPVSAALARHLFQLHFHVLCRSSGLALFEPDL